MITNDWVNFNNSTTGNFSASFKKKLSEQLKEQLYASFGNAVPAAEFNFMLTVGAPSCYLDENQELITTPFAITVNDNYCFANAQLVNAFAQSYGVTVAWAAPEFTDPLQIHTSDVENKQLNFYWCNDLPKEEIIADLAPVKIRLKPESGFKFDVRYHLKVYPDVSLFFEFETKPSQETLDAVYEEVIKFRNTFKTVFVHDMVEYNGGYAISINHNAVDYSSGENNSIEQVIDSFDFILGNIDSNSKINGLSDIIFL